MIRQFGLFLFFCAISGLALAGLFDREVSFSESELQSMVDRARLMADLIESDPAFELMSAPVMNLLSYRCIPPHLQGKVLDEAANEQINDFNVALQKAQRAEGHSFVSRTQRAVVRYGAQPLTLLRAVLLNPLIEERHIRDLLADQQRLGLTIARQLFGDSAEPA